MSESVLLDAQGQVLTPDPWADRPRLSWEDLDTATLTEAVLRLQPEVDIAAQRPPELGALAGIEIHFPAFTDGRGYSQARRLRELGYTGPLRAVGDVLIDQLLLMRRCGIDQFALAAGLSAEQARPALTAFKVAAQPASNNAGLQRRSGAPQAASAS